ncbi:MAG TPA: tetratricopeptide repeat protein, partial [Gemmataceae bacterium]|nr:tetratricopeptide repeat protein [Gemmataceae bacterium]
STGACSVSPDGRWVVFGGPHIRLRVYDVATAQRVWQSPLSEGDRGRFSPDGRWLVTNTDGGRVYAVGTWEPGPQLGPGNPWDVTPELAVLGQSNGIYRLVELATGRELARLEDPEQNTGQASFTPDGTKLVVAAKGGLRVWDLRRIRAELAKLHLDWDAPPYPPAKKLDSKPLQVEVDLGMTVAQKKSYCQRQAALYSIRLALSPFDVQAALGCGKAYDQLGEPARAMDDYGQALVLIAPGKESIAGVPTWEVARSLNKCAWQCAIDRKNDCRKALFLSQKAVELAPGEWSYRNTLGVVCYRLGNYQEARRHLEQSMRDSQSQAAPFDLFFLAMCHQHLGDAPKARECYDQAVRWLQDKKARLSPTWIAELKSFRAEAAGVLGLAKP